ncbi:phage tail protein [Vibrio tubiashii]|uniref:tail fiber protein n=1 Tax=Vibrio tubiashii TaxID=29498 RepID=UPI001EFE8502|nr:tail fiber protein [Vibrio tubiashii]MCG9584620.1 phage tail protein [Vibrio tubiashii]MCG9618148.1 phage tail protein [Vibrio tubiashii]MCG9687413.1 phage tail protein [Vibrio tubiashii]
MSQIIPPPFKIEFPEQVALSDQIAGNRSDVAASEKAVSLVNNKVNWTNIEMSKLAKVHSGADTPTSDIGKDGDVFMVY